MIPKAPYYNGAEFITDEYHIPEEELIAWSQTSLKAWLNAWYMGGCKTIQPKSYTQKQQQTAATITPSPSQTQFVPEASFGIGLASGEDDLPF